MSAVPQVVSVADVRLDERIRRVRALLETRFDYLPGARSTMPATSSGPADQSKYVPCETCRGRGRVIYRRGRRRLDRICMACDGTGDRLRRKDDPAYDSYVGRPRTGPVRSMTANEYDDEISRLRELADTRAGKTGHERYGYERARAARDVAGSYLELDQAVAVIQRRQPGTKLGSWEALYFLQAMMGPTIRLPGALHAALAEERKEVILQLGRLGWSAGEIGRALGISRDRIRQVLKVVRPA